MCGIAVGPNKKQIVHVHIGAAWRNVEIMKWQNAGGFTCSLRGAFQNGMRAGASSG